jgi:hypothetical protein
LKVPNPTRNSIIVPNFANILPDTRETIDGSKDIRESLILNSERLGQFLLHNESTIRLSTLSLLITATTATKPISGAALKSILAGLPSLYAESDAHLRQESLGLIKQFMWRLRGPITQKDFLEKEGKDAKVFMEKFINFIEEELTPTASYQRHVSALTSVSILLNTGVDPNASHISQKEQVLWRYKIHVLRPSLFRVLVDLLLDPFDDIRGMALDIISLFPLQIPEIPGSEAFNTRERLIAALSRAEALASKTSRADHADTVARLYHGIFSIAGNVNGPSTGDPWFITKVGVVDEILRRLEGKLFHEAGIFQTSLQDAPLHGHTSALK